MNEEIFKIILYKLQDNSASNSHIFINKIIFSPVYQEILFKELNTTFTVEMVAKRVVDKWYFDSLKTLSIENFMLRSKYKNILVDELIELLEMSF